MDWIKKNYAQAVLAVVALALLAMSVVLIMMAGRFGDTFATSRSQVRPNNTIPPLDLVALEQARTKLESGRAWMPKPENGPMFVPTKYVIQDNVPVNPLGKGTPLHAPVPNSWFIENNLDILSTNILEEDADQDGFTNMEEWTGMKQAEPGRESTDPQNRNSHPPIINKLRLTKFISQPFRLQFNAYDGDPAKAEEMTFQINTLDVNQPTQFRKIGEQIEGTKFKVTKFELKKVNQPSTGMDEDVSEVSVQNIETGDVVVLIMEKVVNSPDSFGVFKFLLDGTDFRVKKNKVFALKPEPDHQYKLIDIREAGALIEDLKTGEKIKVPRL